MNSIAPTCAPMGETIRACLLPPYRNLVGGPGESNQISPASGVRSRAVYGLGGLGPTGPSGAGRRRRRRPQPPRPPGPPPPRLPHVAGQAELDPEGRPEAAADRRRRTDPGPGAGRKRHRVPARPGASAVLVGPIADLREEVDAQPLSLGQPGHV